MLLAVTLCLLAPSCTPGLLEAFSRPAAVGFRHRSENLTGQLCEDAARIREDIPVPV